jgi:hypothetical protein
MPNRIITRGLGTKHGLITRGYGSFTLVVEMVYEWTTRLFRWLGRGARITDSTFSAPLSVSAPIERTVLGDTTEIGSDLSISAGTTHCALSAGATFTTAIRSAASFRAPVIDEVPA